jgi:hypothetical protein
VAIDWAMVAKSSVALEPAHAQSGNHQHDNHEECAPSRRCGCGRERRLLPLLLGYAQSAAAIQALSQKTDATPADECELRLYIEHTNGDGVLGMSARARNRFENEARLLIGSDLLKLLSGTTWRSFEALKASVGRQPHAPAG